MIPSRSAGFLVALTLAGCLGAALTFHAQAPALPAVHAGISAGAGGSLVLTPDDGPAYTERERAASWTLAQLRGAPRGTATGIALDFGKPGFTGTLTFGLIPSDTRYPLPVFRATVPVKDGKAEIDIKGRLAGTYDMVGWAQRGRGLVGYRLMAQDGTMLHDGRVAFKGTGPFEVDATILEGPFVANVTDRQAVVWFEMDRAAACEVEVEPQGRASFDSVQPSHLAQDGEALPHRSARGNAEASPYRSLAHGNAKASPYRAPRSMPCRAGEAHQEMTIDKLAPGTTYRYTVRYADSAESYGFRTAPRPGARQAFTFGYASDSRGGVGGGERNFLGPNAHIMRRIMALAADRRLAFLQFTGDLVSGSIGTPAGLAMELANWKHAVEPQAHWMPIYTGIGNHELVFREFAEPGGKTIRLPRFPFETDSAEATFARALVNPDNGPASEDGAAYDPNPATADFPPYRETVYSYIHDNVAVVVLDSDYWFTPGVQQAPGVGGNLHGYIMDNQMAWLARQLDAFERNPAIDHVFLSPHAPAFPNGGHVGDAMWYRGNNAPRPTVAGKPVKEGIIERRDDLLRLIQSHPKVLALLTGDEHNYNRLQLGPGVTIYPPDWKGQKVTLRRTFYQVNNGAAGAPYYAQEQTPWSAHVSGFSTQNALCLFHVHGKHVRLEVVNPETLEVIDGAVLR